MKDCPMKEFIDKEATGSEALRIDLWSVFKPLKFKKFKEEFESGKSFVVAYDSALNM